ncbi:MAG: hypothetical protein H5U06_06665 [Candidatus Aminicenantes bacterium]|nr:hypothetical protein [Candidatus Aminicenantes bacterium]
MLIVVESNGCTDKSSFKVETRQSKNKDGSIHNILKIVRIKPDNCKKLPERIPILFNLEKDLNLSGNFTYSIENRILNAEAGEGSLYSILEKYFSLKDVKQEEIEYEGFLIRTSDGKQEIDQTETVSFAVQAGQIKRLRIHLKAATKDLTFARYLKVPSDGSNFASWFVIECKDLQSFDGTPVTYEPFLMGGYAGISPEIKPGYSLYDKLKEISGQLGLPLPERTFAIYSLERHPIYEFFCYRQLK